MNPEKIVHPLLKLETLDNDEGKKEVALLNRGMICAVKGCFGYPICLV